MSYQESRSAYSSAAASSASEAGLLQLVYTRVAQDFLCAASAIRSNDIQTRCDCSKHALLLLGHLENWASAMEEASLAESLHSFYAMLRRCLLAAQTSAQFSSMRP